MFFKLSSIVDKMPVLYGVFRLKEFFRRDEQKLAKNGFTAAQRSPSLP
jgi:hypothetical protein